MHQIAFRTLTIMGSWFNALFYYTITLLYYLQLAAFLNEFQFHLIFVLRNEGNLALNK